MNNSHNNDYTFELIVIIMTTMINVETLLMLFEIRRNFTYVVRNIHNNSRNYD